MHLQKLENAGVATVLDPTSLIQPLISKGSVDEEGNNNRHCSLHTTRPKNPNCLSLLVVEDNPGDFVLLKKSLQRTSLSIESIHWAQQLSQADAILKENEIDVAFLDLTLPDSSGIDSFVTLNNCLPHVPIIVLSGLANTEVAVETISLGAQDFLMKGEFDEKLLEKSIHYSFERKKTLEKLKESNERFEYVTQATFDAIWDLNLLTKELYWADNFRKLFGHAPAVERKNFEMWQQLLHPDDQERVIQRLNKVIQGEENNWAEEYRFKKANGQYATVLDKAVVLRNNNAKAYRMIGAMQDITRQKEEEHTLKLFKSVIVNTNDGVLITEAEPENFPSPRIVYVNEAMSRITGYSREEWIGNTPKILYGPKSDANELERLRMAVAQWQSCEIEVISYKKSGEEFWMNFSVLPIADERGKFTHWITIARDVTDHKNYTKAIEDQNVKLKEIAWMQSHVVRAPLARIMGLISVIEDYSAMNMTQEELLAHIVNSANELDTIIKDIVLKSSAIDFQNELSGK